MSNETSLKNLAAALIKAQLDMDPLHKDKTNPHLNSKYATLAGVQEVALPTLGKYEIAIMQSVSTDWNETGALVRVGCTLMHAPSGEFVTNEIALRPTKSDPQGIGSAITYGRRYLLMTMAGLAPEDDDGNEASGKQTQKAQAQPQRQAPTQPQQPQHRQPEPPASNGEKSKAFKAFMAEGNTLFAKDWEPARHWLIERFTKKATPDKIRTSANDLTDAELNELSSAIKTHGATLKSDFSKQAQKEKA